MLLELYVENFILIDKMDIEFSNGLNVITGETGSGKSLIFQAIKFVMGDKLGKEILKVGSEKAIVKAVFVLETTQELQKKFEDYGIYAEDNLLIIEREINSNGRSISRINSKPVVMSVVKDIRKNIIDIHSQHEHQGLLDWGNHLTYLDNFIGAEIRELKGTLKEKYSKYKKICESIEQLEQDAKDRERSIDMFRFQLEEIDGADLKEDEEEELIRRRNILSNALNITDKLNFCYNTFSGTQDYGHSVLDSISDIINNLEAVSGIDKKIDEIKKTIEDSYYTLEESRDTIREYVNSIEFDEEELTSIHERIDLINKLKRKYGETISKIIEYREDVFNKLKKLMNFQDEENRLHEEKESIKSEVELLCEETNVLRKQYSSQLEAGIKQQLSELHMKNVDFKVSIEKDNMSSNGWDKVEFLISTNTGEPLKGIHKIVSGGELSRIMLAIKIILSKADNIDTMLFDEIDTGISGETAWAISQKLGRLSKDKQLFSITHLPQIASMSDKHILVYKKVLNNSTFSISEVLDNEKKCYEIARLIDGSSYDEMSLEHAKQMIDKCHGLK